MIRALTVLLILSAASLEGQNAGDLAASRLWSAHIQPLFAENCFKCHGNIETKSGLRLMSPADLFKGGDNGPVVVPGKPEKSLVYQYVQANADPHMPPKGRSLSDEEIALLRRWIEKLSPAEAFAATNVAREPEIEAGTSPLFRKAAWHPPARWSAAQTIDHLIEKGWHELHVKPSDICDDRTFVRRTYLDIAGRIPLPAESEAFLSDKRRDKRAALANKLLDSEEYAVRMREVFDVVFMERGAFQTPRERRRNPSRNDSIDRWQRYLEWSFRENRPWNVMAREIILARPATNESRGAMQVLFARQDNAQQMAEVTGSTLLGLQIKCAQCHDHPLAPEIKQAHYWGLVAAFNRSKAVETSMGPGVGESAIGGFIKFTNLKGASTDALLTFLDGRAVVESRPKENEKEMDAAENYMNGTPLGDGKDLKMTPVPKFSRREQLANWLTATNNPLLARSLVNRLWAMFLGRGLVQPLDRMDSSRPCSHPELLDWLAEDFAKNGYDVKRLIRNLTATRVYQLDSRPAGKVSPPAATFACGLEKQLSAEVLARSMLIAAGNEPGEDGRMAGFDLPAVQRTFADAFPDLFPTEQVSSLRQALFLSNNRTVASVAESSRTNSLRQVTSLDDRRKVRALFARALGREPNPAELERSVEYLRMRSEQPDSATRQLLWALLTSAEFRFNH